MPTQLPQTPMTEGAWLRPMAGLPIALYNAAVVALIIHVASGWLFGLRIAYLGFLTGAATAVVAMGFGVSEIMAMARGPARRDAIQTQAITLGATAAYAAAGYHLYRSYQARFVVEGADLRHVPALVLVMIAIASAAALGWVAWMMARDRAADQRS